MEKQGGDFAHIYSENIEFLANQIKLDNDALLHMKKRYSKLLELELFDYLILQGKMTIQKVRWTPQ